MRRAKNQLWCIFSFLWFINSIFDPNLQTYFQALVKIISFVAIVMLFLGAAHRVGAVEYRVPQLDPPAFDVGEVAMLDAELRSYAENLAAVVCEDLLAPFFCEEVGRLQDVPGSVMENARKLMGVALHLEPRGRYAVVANAMLREGRLPSPLRGRMAPQAFSSLMLRRAEALEEAGGEANLRLRAYFLEVARVIDPGNEDAVYAFEIFQMDGHEVDWSPILGDEDGE